MIMLAGLFLWLMKVTLVYSQIETLRKPNYVIFYLENIDQIIPDLQSPVIAEELYNLKLLVDRSITFHNVYGEFASTSTFGALFTGKPAVDIGIIRGKLLPFDSFPSLASSGGLSTKESNLASILSKDGYRTSLYGYWKLGFGPHGMNNPLKHGFDTWFGVAYPHNEWCEQEKSAITNQEASVFSHQYLKLFYHTSFLWLLLFLILTVLAWFKFVAFYLYLNLLVYTVSTAVSFYILLHLFVVQRSASCVLYKDNDIHLQPYDMNNLTLHFTSHASKFLMEQEKSIPFLMMVNYLKMMPPYVHSQYFIHERSRPRRSALMELDWSIGYLLDMLERYDLFDNTMIVLTGGNSCSKRKDAKILKGFQRSTLGDGFEEVIVDHSLNECFKIPLWIKEVENTNSNYETVRHVLDLVPIHNLLHTIVEASQIKRTNQSFLKSFRREDKSKCPLNTLTEDFQLKLTRQAMSRFTQIGEGRINSNTSFEDHGLKTAVKPNPPPLFHYVNIQKPVFVTLEKGIQIVYYFFDESRYLQKLAEPIIILTHNLLRRFVNESSEDYLQDLLHQSKQLIHNHLVKRQPINLWSSQFEMPVYPWLLPCSNFPRCRKVWTHYEDFDHLFPDRQTV